MGTEMWQKDKSGIIVSTLVPDSLGCKRPWAERPQGSTITYRASVGDLTLKSPQIPGMPLNTELETANVLIRLCFPFSEGSSCKAQFSPVAVMKFHSQIHEISVAW